MAPILTADARCLRIRKPSIDGLACKLVGQATSKPIGTFRFTQYAYIAVAKDVGNVAQYCWRAVIDDFEEQGCLLLQPLLARNHPRVLLDAQPVDLEEGMPKTNPDQDGAIDR